MPWSAAIAAGGALGSGYLGSEGSKDAGAATAAATNRGIDAQREMYNSMRTDLDPYRKAGLPALWKLMYLSGIDPMDTIKDSLRSGYTTTTTDEPKDATRRDKIQDQLKLNALALPGSYGMYFDDNEGEGGPRTWSSTVDQGGLDAAAQRLYDQTRAGGEFGSLTKSFGMEDFVTDPGYEFRKSEGEKALTRGASARGLAKSTPGLRSLMSFNQDLASSEYGNAYSRFEANKSQKFNVLSFLSGTGQNAAAMTGQAGVNTGAGISQAAIAGGVAAGNAAMGSASAWNNAIQGGLSNYMYQQRWKEQQDMYKGIFSQPSGGGKQNWSNTGDWNGSTTA